MEKEKENNGFKFKPKPIIYINDRHVTACTIHYIVEHLLSKEEYKALTRTVCQSSLWNDLYQEVILRILSKNPIEKYRELLIKGEFKFYFYKFLKVQWEGSNSTFFHLHRDYYHSKSDWDFGVYENLLVDDADEVRNKIKEEMDTQNLIYRYKIEKDKLGWYERKIWDMYENMSVPQISRELKIKKDSLYKTIKQVKLQLENKLKK